MTFDWLMKIVTENWPMFIRGAGITMLISIVGTILGFIIGLIIGGIRTIPLPERGAKRVFLRAIRAIFSTYIEIFRGTPMIVQAMVIFYGSALAFGADMDRLYAAFLIVSINTGAYMAEIVRGGILSIDKGQYEAAQAIGMNHFRTMFHIVLPQAIRNVIPSIGNQFVINIKDTSVLNVISVSELFFQTKSIAGNNFRYFESFFVACVLYLIMTITVSRILAYIEKKLDGPENYAQIVVEAPEDMYRKNVSQ